MSKIERRFENGKLSFKDVAEWTRGKGPSKVHNLLKGIWNVEIRQPAIAPSFEDTYFDSGKNKIYLGFNNTAKYGQMLKEAGVVQTLDGVLSSNLGEEDTHYISYNTVPENFSNQDSLFLRPGRSSYDNFMKEASKSVQIEAIGFIGRKYVAKNVGFANVEEAERSMLTKSAEGFDMWVKNLLNDKAFKKMLDSPTKNAGAINQIAGIFQDAITHTLSGAGEFVASKDLEKEYSGRFPELMRTVLTPSQKYSNIYLDFIGRYYPHFKVALEDFLLGVK
jgi:hypothetical protein